MTQLVEQLHPDLWLKCDETNVTDGAVLTNSGDGGNYPGTDWHFAGSYWQAQQPPIAPIDGYSVSLAAGATASRLQVYPIAPLVYHGMDLIGSETKAGSAIVLGFFEVPASLSETGAFISRITEFGITRITEDGEVLVHDYIEG